MRHGKLLFFQTLGNNSNLKRHRISAAWLEQQQACNLPDCERFLQSLRTGESLMPMTEFEVTVHLVQRAAQAGVLDVAWFCYQVLTWGAYQRWLLLADKLYFQEGFFLEFLPGGDPGIVRNECQLRAFLCILKEGDSRYATE